MKEQREETRKSEPRECDISLFRTSDSVPLLTGQGFSCCGSNVAEICRGVEEVASGEWALDCCCSLSLGEVSCSTLLSLDADLKLRTRRNVFSKPFFKPGSSLLPS